MARMILAFSVIALMATTAGCRMCADPYDYCGPLFTGDCCGPPCAPYDRAGSILSGGCASCGPAAIPTLETTIEVAPEAAEPAPAESDKIDPVPDEYTGPLPKPLPKVPQQVERTYPARPRSPQWTARTPQQ